jgi:hypothetical protein
VKSKLQLFIFSAYVIIIFDAVGSLSSRWMHFDYGQLMSVSFCLYMGCGYLGFQFQSFRGALQAGLMAGLVDSTIGWMISSAIHLI